MTLLSVLIPAYKYPQGVLRILNGLATPRTDFEVLIFDDSPDDAVERAVTSWAGAHSERIRYRRNGRALGASGNWNALLRAAQGKYSWLIHHDEFPVGPAFMDRLLKLLETDAADVALLDCILVSEPSIHPPRLRRHLPNTLRIGIARHLPAYINWRNVIGPTGAIVVRSDLYPSFDGNLKWFVDTDMYVRLLSKAPRTYLYDSLAVGSCMGVPGSITASMAKSIPEVAARERAYLKQQRSSPYGKSAALAQIGLVAEAILWAGIRFLTYPVSGISGARMREVLSALGHRNN